MKKLLVVFLCLLPIGLFSEVLKEGSGIAPLIVVKDQFEKEVALNISTKQIIVAFTREQGNQIKAFLDQNPKYLSEHNALYLMDATQVPSFVMRMFMMPKFKQYTYPIGIVNDENDAGYLPKQEGKITIISLENLHISAIAYQDQL